MADLLVDLLKRLRERHRRSREYVARHMGIGLDTLRHIENGRRPLPDFQHGRIRWVRDYLKSLEAPPEEEQEALELASRTFVEQFSDWLRDIETHYSESRHPSSKTGDDK